MVTDRIEVDPGLLRDAGNRLLQVYQQVSQVNATLPNVLSVAGTPWGDDSYGSTFYTGDGKNPGYQSGSAGLLQGLNTLTAAVQDYADGMVAAAAALQGQDTISAAGLSA
ncbi:hypothetical protein KO481_27685 [Nocardia sp. NEAU-G5]|uniref:PE domain-containing protein n=1 Tax=Nocardia albiluteola TaxID=2842303 RepID=A0ABS6B6C9_9NOCA|nr:hypothetical protein [Nocardia albiluteola]MBU3065296.1 hypothetical protein [Nocardia albiluteola]